MRSDKMSIGYACLTQGVPDTGFKTCRQDNATEEKLLELIRHNLKSLENIIDYNIKNDIKLFRISSDIIPFGSSPVNELEWWEIFADEFDTIADKIEASNMRVSMHPGQYTVLNSPNPDVVERAILDLKYHTRFLRSVGGGPENKIILHIGGVYGDKKQAMERFAVSYRGLDPEIKDHLVIENDDRSYTIKDVLEIGESLEIPVVFDNLHHAINKSDNDYDDIYWLNRVKQTWRDKDGKQKIHYSQQDPGKKPGGHSKTIGINDFMAYYNKIKGDSLDIMLEVKDKNLSAVKCINTTSTNKKIKKLEQEWGKYKYTTLEKAPANYVAIRQLLKDKDNYPAIEFYNLIENSMEEELTIGNGLNGALHVWGYFKNIASDKEKTGFLKSIAQYEESELPIKKVKNILWKLALKYDESYLLESYYFIF